MNIDKRPLWVAVFLLALLLTASAQLAVTVSSPKLVGQKAVVKLVMKNGLKGKVESARAVCFLLDDHGIMVGQATKWVIGQNQTGLAPGATNTFNFVIASPRPFATTNVIAKLTFTQIVLDDGKGADVRQSVIVTAAVK